MPDNVLKKHFVLSMLKMFMLLKILTVFHYYLINLKVQKKFKCFVTMNICTTTFDQFNAPLFNTSINFLKKKNYVYVYKAHYFHNCASKLLSQRYVKTFIMQYVHVS